MPLREVLAECCLWSARPPQAVIRAIPRVTRVPGREVRPRQPRLQGPGLFHTSGPERVITEKSLAGTRRTTSTGDTISGAPSPRSASSAGNQPDGTSTSICWRNRSRKSRPSTTTNPA